MAPLSGRKKQDPSYYAAYRAARREAINARKRLAYAEHRETHVAQARAYRLTHREELRKHSAQRYQQKREQKLAAQARYRATHRAEILAAKKKEYQINQEENKQKSKAYYAANRERARAYHKAYRITHRDVFIAIQQRRKARQHAIEGQDFSPAQWSAVKKYYHYRCVYCGKKPKELTQDHITPVIQGGAYTLWNIVPACRSCNSKKRANGPLVPIQPLLCIA